jgi:hypothetical protein
MVIVKVCITASLDGKLAFLPIELVLHLSRDYQAHRGEVMRHYDDIVCV